jgi:hypothetical protein
VKQKIHFFCSFFTILVVYSLFLTPAYADIFKYPRPIAGDLIKAPSFNEYGQAKDIQMEIEAGPWWWQNNLAGGIGGFANLGYWKKVPSGLTWGFTAISSHLYGAYSSRSEHSWTESDIGIEPGIRINSFYYDKKAMKKRPYQLEMKATLRYELLSIHDYERNQYNVLGGLAAKYMRQISDNLDIQVMGEWRYGFSKNLDSSLCDDTVDSRTHFLLAAYGRYRLDRNWALIVGGGPFHRGWDDSWGIKADIGVEYKRISLTVGNLFYPFGLIGDYHRISAEPEDLLTTMCILKIRF